MSSSSVLKPFRRRMVASGLVAAGALAGCLTLASQASADEPPVACSGNYVCYPLKVYNISHYDAQVWEASVSNGNGSWREQPTEHSVLPPMAPSQEWLLGALDGESGGDTTGVVTYKLQDPSMPETSGSISISMYADNSWSFKGGVTGCSVQGLPDVTCEVHNEPQSHVDSVFIMDHKSPTKE